MAQDSNTPPECLEILANDPDLEVRSWVAANPNTPVGSLEKLARDEIRQVTREVAANPNTSKALLEEMITFDHQEFRSFATKNPNVTPEILAKLTHDPAPAIRNAAAASPAATPNLLEQFANEGDVNVCDAIARNPKAPLAVLKQLAQDKHLPIRLGAAHNPMMLSPELRSELAEDPNEEVLRLILTSAPSETLETLFEEAPKSTRVWIAQNPNTPPELLQRLAHDSDLEVFLETVKNPATPTHILKELAVCDGKSEPKDVQTLRSLSTQFVEAVFTRYQTRSVERYLDCFELGSYDFRPASIHRTTDQICNNDVGVGVYKVKVIDSEIYIAIFGCDHDRGAIILFDDQGRELEAACTDDYYETIHWGSDDHSEMIDWLLQGEL